MDYKYIESLLLSAKNGNIFSVEKLTEEFTPLIKSLCNKTYLTNYTKEDLQEECYLTLLKCIKTYKPESHRFVAYATNAIKNNLNYLIRKNLIHRELTSQDCLTSTGALEHLNLSSRDKIDEELLHSHTKKSILEAIETLSYEEKELFIYVLLKRNTLKSYSQLKNISYSSTSKIKSKVLKKITNYIEDYYFFLYVLQQYY